MDGGLGLSSWPSPFRKSCRLSSNCCENSSDKGDRATVLSMLGRSKERRSRVSRQDMHWRRCCSRSSSASGSSRSRRSTSSGGQVRSIAILLQKPHFLLEHPLD